MTSIAFFPVVVCEKQLIDLLSRAAWFLSFSPANRIFVPISSPELVKLSWRVAPGMDAAIARQFDALKRKVVFVVAEKEYDLAECMSEADIVLRWEKDSKPPFVSSASLGRWLKGKKIWEVDPDSVRMEGSFYIEAGLHLTANKPALVKENQAKFNRLSHKLGKFKRAYLLATGPSVSGYKLHDFKGALSIVCNSVILDEALMQAVEPKILVFADPIFHFGPSQYAGEFRKKLLESAKRHDFTICMPFKYYPLFVEAMPELASRTIGIPFTKDRAFNFSLDQDFNLKTTANILTFLMVPLAGTFADEIGILGCDGRPLSEDNYFWGHNEKTQINDKMANIRAIHPGFFAIDYNDYYLEHCRLLEEQLLEGQKQGKTFHGLAFSHIPALASRLKRVWRKFAESTDPAPQQAVMLDPDGVDTSGHFIAYNTQLGDSLEKADCSPVVLCNKDIDRNLLAQHPNYLPRLSVRSWTFGATDNADSHRKARTELLSAIDELMVQEAPTLLYMYAGSLNHAAVLAEATRRHAALYVNINLFWLSFKDFLASRAYVDVWREFFQWLDQAGPRFVATVPTNELRDEIAQKFGVVLDVAPHPSTAVPDELLMQYSKRQTGSVGPVKVLFPGSLRSEKGYSVGIDCARALGVDAGLRTFVRHVTTASTPSELQAVPSDLPTNATLVEGKLDNDQFMQLFIDSDIVVLPYSAEAFRKRTSGLLIDALACGLPAVVVEGTWLAGHVARHQCGVVVADASPEAICVGIRQIVANLENFRGNTMRAAADYFRDNSWEALAAFLLKPFAAERRYPRLLAIDLTGIGGISATARVKEAFFRGWPRQSLGCVSFDSDAKCLRSDGLGVEGPTSDEALIDAIRAFDPEVVYYRAVDSELVHDFAVKAINALDKPFVVHLMDDWPSRLRETDPARFERIDGSLRELISHARAALSIGDAMAAEFGRRYGVEFTPFANAIDPAAFPPRRSGGENKEFVISYAGALAEDMVLDSVTNVAFAIESMPSGLNVRLHIHTRPPWFARAKKAFGNIPAVRVLEPVAARDYYALLQNSDAVLIAYNFDQRSRNYIGYSIANKMPECMASGTPILALGSAEVATIAYLDRTGTALVVDQPDQPAITKAIRKLVEVRSETPEFVHEAREVAFQRHNVWDVASRFRALLCDVADRKGKHMIEQTAIVGPYRRSDHAHWDETQAVAQLFASHLKGSTMIDVGAHHGSALMPFLNKAWDVLAFEPDEKNRGQLLERLGKHKYKDRVSLDIRAVSDHSQKGLTFYRSEVSTGISGLSAFHESHHEAQRVDTVTLSEFLAGKQLAQVDFLKIDTEGHDLFVLKGFPWERFRPAVIECEFEDSKTVPLDYTFHDLAGYLVEKGYTVYVSEWHPVIRYGIRHDWNRLMRYPCRLSDDKSWGNILAFREPIDAGELINAVDKVMKVGINQAAGSKAAALLPPAVPTSLASVASDTGMTYRSLPSPHFSVVSQDVWRYVPLNDGSHKIWMAAFDLTGWTQECTFAGGIRLKSDKAMDVTVSLGRHGASDYEGVSTRIRLSPGVAQTVQLRKVFAKKHSALKIQIEVMQLDNASEAELILDSIYLLEGLSSLRHRIADNQLTLPIANRSFRQGDHAMALGLYLLLHQKRPLKIYVDNALMSARRLRMHSVRTLDDLLEHCR